MLIKYNNHLLFYHHYYGIDDDFSIYFCKDHIKTNVAYINYKTEYEIQIKFLLGESKIYIVVLEDPDDNNYQIYISASNSLPPFRRIKLDEYKYYKFIKKSIEIINAYKI